MSSQGIFNYKTQVIHIRDEAKWSRRQCIYIGRGSKWGNPFVVGKDGTRAEVIQKYKDYIRSRFDLVADAQRELKGAVLMCYCKPKACHGDVLVELVEGAK